VTRLTVDDWLAAGLEVLGQEGIAGVKVPRLCERLGVTKGSFYWHFEHLDAFLTELARRWASEGLPPAADTDSDPDSGSDLLLAMRLFADRRNRELARAMRDWAQSDERARAAIRKVDHLLFERVKASMAALGFDEDEAEVRAKILYYAGVGFAHVGPLGKGRSAQAQVAATWELLTAP
jgi:AcrR family transcriptional regulator